MTVHPFPNRNSRPAAAVVAYFSTEQVTTPMPRLRPLSALEQMYAYWGSDLA